jgi:NAD(P)H-flavin reductase
MKNVYTPIEAEIREVIDETPTIKTFVVEPRQEIVFKAGQFMELTVPGLGEAPFTPSSSPSQKGKIDFTVMKVGKVTDALHEMKKGQTVGLRGPFGVEYPLDKWKDKEILIVGGGVGGAPLRALFLALTERLGDFKKILYCYGARTPEDIIYKDLIQKEWQKIDPNKVEIRLTVDEGDAAWKGNVGVVTTVVEKINLDLKTSIGVVCGPPIMMKFATFRLIEIGYPEEAIYLSMEKNMSCGIGKCGHCMLGEYMVCKDGPVLTYDLVKDKPALWD